MADWSQDEFMSSWDKTYVSTNLKANAKPYSKELFLSLNEKLRDTEPSLATFSHSIIAAASCAVGRADVVGRFFDDLTIDSTPEESQRIFLQIREAITIVFPFLGIPTCIPACYGIIGVLRRKGENYGITKAIRKPAMDLDDVQRGQELRSRIYSGVGNSEIFGFMQTFFLDLYNCSTNFTWGYLISKTNEEVYQVQQSHLIVASAITALGATRQTRSHIKATIGIGNSVETVKVVVETVSKIASWADRPITSPDVDALASQIRAALQAEKQS